MNDYDEHRPHTVHDQPHDPHEKPRKKRRRRHGKGFLIIVLLLLIIIAILVLMLVYGGFGGSGSGSGGSGENGGSGTVSNVSASDIDSREPSAPETETGSEQGNAIVIEINGEKIIVDGTELADAAALKEHLLSINSESSIYILRDNHALKSVYDEAKAVLDELSYDYSEET